MVGTHSRLAGISLLPHPVGWPELSVYLGQQCPRLEPLGLDWINFAVLRRTHSTLHQARRTDPKIIADQQGHGLGVHMSEYVDSSMTAKRAAVSALWEDFKALTPVAAIPN